MDTSSDEQLIANALQGDHAAISTLYQKYRTDIYRFIFYRVGNTEDAEDLFQEVMMAAFDGLKNFRGDASFRNWCYEIARNKIARLWKKTYDMTTTEIEEALGMHADLETEEARMDALSHDEVKTAMVDTILDSLEPAQKKVLEYRFLKNYSIKETATAMNVSVSNAKVIQHRALKKAAALHPDFFTTVESV